MSISIWNQILIEADSQYSNLSLRTGEGRRADIISQTLVPSRNWIRMQIFTVVLVSAWFWLVHSLHESLSMMLWNSISLNSVVGTGGEHDPGTSALTVPLPFWPWCHLQPVFQSLLACHCCQSFSLSALLPHFSTASSVCHCSRVLPDMDITWVSHQWFSPTHHTSSVTLRNFMLTASSIARVTGLWGCLWGIS